MTQDEMVRWHHQLDGHDFEQALGVGDGQGSLACFSPWGYKESDTTEATQQQQQDPATSLRCNDLCICLFLVLICELVKARYWVFLGFAVLEEGHTHKRSPVEFFE